MLTTSAQGQEQTKEHKRSLGPFVPVERVSAGKEEMIQGIMKISTAKVKTTGVYQRVMRRSIGLGGRFRGLGVLYHVENPAHGGSRRICGQCVP